MSTAAGARHCGDPTRSHHTLNLFSHSRLDTTRDEVPLRMSRGDHVDTYCDAPAVDHEGFEMAPEAEGSENELSIPVDHDALDGPVPEAAVPGQRVLDVLDKAIAIQSPLVRKNIARARQRNPEATPAEVIGNLERMYVSALTGTGAAVGGAAAAPGVGTGVALALSAGEFLSSLELSALFALSIAEIHGVRIDEIERRRTIVMGIMLGGSGSATITKVAERTGQHWGRQIVAKVPLQTLRQINKVLGRHFITKYGTKQGIIVLGRMAPFGIGAVIGGGANAALATLAVRAGRRAFGPPPTTWP